MNAVRRLTFRKTLQSALVLGLIAVMVLLASGELLAGHCDSDTENTCTDSCTDCDDCVRCQGTIHMLSAADVDIPRPDITPGWSVESPSLQSISTHADGIDRPPQNLL